MSQQHPFDTAVELALIAASFAGGLSALGFVQAFNDDPDLRRRQRDRDGAVKAIELWMQAILDKLENDITSREIIPMGPPRELAAANRDGDPDHDDILELYCWAYHPEGGVSPAEQARRIEHFRVTADAYWAARGRLPQDGGRVSDGHSWRELCDAAMANDGGTITNLDAFAEAVSKAEVVGQQINSWVAHPNTALTLAKLKDETASARPLLGPDATSPTKKSVLGIPLFSAPGCSPTYICGIPRATAYVVIRVPASVEVDRSVKFTSDQTAVRCVLRVGFGWPHPASIIRIGIGGS